MSPGFPERVVGVPRGPGSTKSMDRECFRYSSAVAPFAVPEDDARRGRPGLRGAEAVRSRGFESIMYPNSVSIGKVDNRVFESISRDLPAIVRGECSSGIRLTITPQSSTTRQNQSPTAIAARSVSPTHGRIRPTSPASATICGDGVSPAASAAASGSPPGSPPAPRRRAAGAGSGSRQRRMTRSTAGFRPETCDDGFDGVRVLRRSGKARLPVNSSYSTSPSA